MSCASRSTREHKTPGIQEERPEIARIHAITDRKRHLLAGCQTPESTISLCAYGVKAADAGPRHAGERARRPPCAYHFPFSPPWLSQMQWSKAEEKIRGYHSLSFRQTVPRRPLRWWGVHATLPCTPQPNEQPRCETGKMAAGVTGLPLICGDLCQFPTIG
jgi:hypothetical protein